jgi:hypothetical protein
MCEHMGRQASATHAQHMLLRPCGALMQHYAAQPQVQGQHWQSPAQLQCSRVSAQSSAWYTVHPTLAAMTALCLCLSSCGSCLRHCLRE